MSMSANIHTGPDATVRSSPPTPGVSSGWVTVDAGASRGDDKVTVFPPEDRAAAIAFLHELAEKARELALMIDASAT